MVSPPAGRLTTSSCAVPVRTRYAPSPTGMLHLGGLRTALFNYLLARRHGGQFIVRIEDTDQARLVPGAVDGLLDDLRWCGLFPDESPHTTPRPSSVDPLRFASPDGTVALLRQDDNGTVEHIAHFHSRVDADDASRLYSMRGHKQVYWVEELRPSLGPVAPLPSAGHSDCGPYVQSERLPYYKGLAEQLVADGRAYRCFCSSERLDRLRQSLVHRGLPAMYDKACAHLDSQEAEARAQAGEPHVIRLDVPTGGGSTSVEDRVLGLIRFPHSSVDDTVLLKSDGYPTYHLASVADDHAMHISHVVRGQEWLSSTPKHVLLYEALGWSSNMPEFAHLPLLLNEDKTKLSKRHGHVSVGDFRQDGYSPEALVNFVALLGWNPGEGDTREVFDLHELESMFSLDHVHKSNAVVMRHKLDWLNGKHLRRTFERARTHPSALATVFDEARPSVIQCLHERLGVPTDIQPTGELPEPLCRPLDHSEGGSHDMVELARRRWAACCQAADPILQAFSRDYVEAALAAQHVRALFPRDLGMLTLPFFAPPDWTSSAAQEAKQQAWNKHADALLEALVEEWRTADDAWFSWSSQEGEDDSASLFHRVITEIPAAVDAMKAIKRVTKAHKGRTGENVKPSALMLPLRWALTGMDKGASLSVILALLGRDVCLARIRAAVAC